MLSVYRSFFVGVREGRFTLGRGGDLWRLLASITKHKLLRQVRHQSADRRSVDLECSLDEVDEGTFPRRERDPTPEEALALADELERVFARTGSLRADACWSSGCKGSPIADIAEDTGRAGAHRSGARLARIRDTPGRTARR